MAPLGPVYQAGTLSGIPVAMAAGLAQLRILKSNPEIYQNLERRGAMLEKGLKEALSGIPAQVNRVGSLLTVFFTENPVNSYEAARSSNLEQFRRWYLGLLEQGIYAAPSQFEAMFLCNAHTDKEVERIIDCAGKIF